MLVLTRTPTQSIFILDGTIRIEILQVRGNQVRIGIIAPEDVDVHREEVYNRIQRELIAVNQ